MSTTKEPSESALSAAREIIDYDFTLEKERMMAIVIDRHMRPAQLFAAAQDLLDAQTMGAELNTPDFMDWIANRLVRVYGESPYASFVQSLRYRARAGRSAIAKATGEEGA